jgi:hypothetical protein
MKLEIHLTDLDALRFIPTEIFDDEGNVVGKITDEDYQEEVKRREGKIIIRLFAYCDNKVASFESPIIGPDERAWALEALFHSLAVSVQRNFYA